MSWVPLLIALFVGVAIGAVGMFVFGPRRAGSGSVRVLSAPESAGALPFSSSPPRPAGRPAPSTRVTPGDGGVHAEVPRGEFESEALQALVEYLNDSGVSGFELKYADHESDHLCAYRGSWAGSLRFGGADRSATLTVSVYRNAPDEVWYNSSIQHGLELGVIPYMRVDQVQGGAWSLQRAEDVPSALALAVVRSPPFAHMCALVAAVHDPVFETTLWAVTLTSDAIMLAYRAQGGDHSPLATLEEVHEAIRVEPFSVPTRAELEQLLSDPGEDASIAREAARNLIDTAPSAAAREAATRLALAHASADVRLTAAVDAACRGDGEAYLGHVAKLLTEVQAAAPTAALSGEVVESMLDALEARYQGDEYAPYVAALLGALTYRSPQRLRAAELARPLLDEGAPRRDEPGVRTFAERILSELHPREDLDAYIGWMILTKSAYYTGAAFTEAVDAGGLGAGQLERVLSVAYSHADGDFYVSDLFGRAARAGEPCEGWRQVVWSVFGGEWVDARVAGLLRLGGDELEANLRVAALLGGAATREQLLKMSKGRGPRRAEAEEALARLDDRVAAGGLSLSSSGGPAGGLSDASSSGGLSDA